MFSIVVILILVGITLPIFLRINEKAQSLRCVYRLKQLGHGFALYASDNDNHLPHEDNGSSKPPKGFVWYNSILPYLGEETKVRAYRQEEGYDYLSDDLVETVFSYKMNSRLEGYKGKKEFESPPFRNLSTVPTPSETICIFDGRTDRRPYKYQPYGTHTSIDSRHDGKASILFLDWSVKRIKNEVDVKKGGWKNKGPFKWDPDTD